MSFVFPTNASQVQAFAGALYGVQVGSTTMAQVNADIAANGGLAATLNSYYAASFGGATTASVANTVATNLGLTGAALTSGAAYVAAQLNAAAPGARGAVISSIVNLFSSLASDATFGAAATAWNAKVAVAAAYTGAANVAVGTEVVTNGVFTLTTSANNFTGTAGQDSFDGAPNSNGTQTFGSADTLDGRGGVDSLAATLTGAANQTVRPKLTAIENLDMTSVQTGGTTGTLDLGASTGYTTLQNIGSTGNLAFNQIASAETALKVTSSSGTTTFTYTDAAGVGANTVSLTLDGATGGISFADQGGSNALETIAITATGSASNLGAGGLTTGASTGTTVGTTKLTIAGGADVNLGTVALATQILTVDASAATGAVSVVTGASTAGQTISGGSGNDTFTLAGTQSDNVSGGAGNDTFIIGNTLLTSTDTLAGGNDTDNLILFGAADYTVGDTPTDLRFTNITGIERISGATVAQGNTAGVDIAVTAGALMKAAGVVRFSDAATGDSAFSLTVGSAYNGTAVTYDFSDVADTASFSATAAGTTAVMTFQGDADGITAGDTLVGGSSTGDTLIFNSAGSTGTIANGDIGGIETVRITATNGSVTMTSVDTQITDASTIALTVDASAASSATTVTLSAIAHALNYTGNAQVDSVTSGSGNDNIALGAGNDVWATASANFTSADTVSGGDGTDTISITDAATVIDSDFTKVTSVEWLSAGLTNGAITATLGALANAAGIVRVNANGSGNLSVTTDAAFTNPLRVALGTGGDTVAAGASAQVVTVSVTETGLTAGDALTGGTSSGDTILLTADADTLAAADIANVTGFENWTVAGDVAAVGITIGDVNIAAGATMTLDASALVSGAFALTFDASADTNGKIVVTGGAGADAVTLTAAGADSVSGGSGIDTITVTSAGFTSADTIAGGDGNDVITMSDSATVVDADFTNVTSVMTLTSTGTGSANTLTATLNSLAAAAGVVSVIGGTGADTVTIDSAYTGTVRVTPTSGADTITAAASAATLQVATALGDIGSTDTWTGGTGAGDTLRVTTGTVTAASMANITAFEAITTVNDGGAFSITTADANVASGVTMTVNATSLVTTNTLTFDGRAETNGTFNLTGGNAGDTVYGGAGADTIDGGAGADSLDGGQGSDSVSGGLGDDTIIAGSATDYADGGTGTDRLVVTSIGSGTFVIDLSATGDQLTTFNGSANATIQQGFESADLSSVNGAVTATASSGGSVIITGAGRDTINDGAGADSLSGGSGNDTITSAAGADSLVGGAGDDRYVVTLNNVGVFDRTITDSAGTDTVVILGAAPSASSRAALDLTAAAFGTNVIDVLDITGMTVNGATVTGSTAAASYFGSDFADSITGGAGADTISGGDGADTIVGGDGIDVLTGGNGRDVFAFNTIRLNANRNDITEFVAGATGDILRFDNASFGVTAGGTALVTTVAATANTAGLSVLVDTAANIAASAATTNVRIAIATDTGAIRYDADGDFSAGSIVIGTITTLTGTITADNFLFV